MPRAHHSVYVVYLRNPKGDGKAGYYRYVVLSVAGAGAYTLGVNVP